MPLSVLSVAYPFAPVTPETAGGAEQVLAQLDRALVQQGHKSLVVAAAGSLAAGRLFELTSRASVINDDLRQQVWGETRASIEHTLREEDVDLVHMHGIDFREYLPNTSVPVLATLHLPPSWYSSESFRAPGNVFLHCVSASAHAACPDVPNLLPPIPNGVDLDRFRPRRRRFGFAFAMGRICPEKGLHDALDAAAKANVPIVLAGKVYPYDAHVKYFQKEIEPRLDGTLRRFIGPVGPARKARLLAAARCVVIPSTAQETSSLVAMEALACGTPVIARPSGALADLIHSGITGFLVQDVAEMTEAIRKSDEINPASCREYAEKNFDLRQTIQKYFGVYERLTECRSR